MTDFESYDHPPDEAPLTSDEVKEAIDHFNWEVGGEYVAQLVAFDGEDYIIRISHYGHDEQLTGIVGQVYSVEQLGDWMTALEAYEKVTPRNQNGNIPTFTPTMIDGDVL